MEESSLISLPDLCHLRVKKSPLEKKILSRVAPMIDDFILLLASPSGRSIIAAFSIDFGAQLIIKEKKGSFIDE